MKKSSLTIKFNKDKKEQFTEKNYTAWVELLKKNPEGCIESLNGLDDNTFKNIIGLIYPNHLKYHHRSQVIEYLRDKFIHKDDIPDNTKVKSVENNEPSVFKIHGLSTEPKSPDSQSTGFSNFEFPKEKLSILPASEINPFDLETRQKAILKAQNFLKKKDMTSFHKLQAFFKFTEEELKNP